MSPAADIDSNHIRVGFFVLGRSESNRTGTLTGSAETMRWDGNMQDDRSQASPSADRTTLKERGGRIKADTVAAMVFQGDRGFDPRMASILRTEAGRIPPFKGAMLAA